MTTQTWLLVGALAAVAACTTGPVGEAAQTTSTTASARADGRSPLALARAPEESARSFEGEVVERLDAGTYLYFAVEDAAGVSRWVTTLRTTSAAVGDTVKVNSFGVRDEFRSKRLSRTFDRLHFGIVRKAD
ncbi:MAG: hypothetical protein HOW73_17950 [Polyangiaceae bacterium]|nr:hypothetical protein [Polyangiaceae bacterium]